jgi:putative ABC transport system permease protein
MPLRPAINLVLVFWDKSTRSLVLALRSLWLHKLRAFLSVLGIIIGTAAVISLMAFGEGSMQDALDDIGRHATNIVVRSVKPPDDASSQRRSFVATYGLTERDYEAFKLLPNIEEHLPMRIADPQEVRRLERMQQGRVVGTTENYPRINPLQMQAGRFLLDSDSYEGDGDNVHMRNVCVLGSEIAWALFPFDDNPVGKTIVLNRHHYVVIGVVAERLATGGTGGTQAGEQFNNDVYVPLRTFNARFGNTIFIRQSGSRSGEQVKYHQIVLKVRKEEGRDWMKPIEDTGIAVRDWLSNPSLSSHYRKDWEVVVPLDRLKEAERARDRYTMLLAVIALISLLVGGIGIMNIMLATVTERTREIGIRRALGAKRRDIVMQFLIEAVAQTCIGGLFGVIIGLGSTFGFPLLWQLFDSRLPARLNVPSIFISLFASIAVGVLAGLYPAWRASRLDPIEALRHE